ncbi:MAG TPA: nuclear transport factor 2 family protein [Candidatus Binatia bacterium]|nr:nuclear transport factor 2 family protein [Candidatus Binatia bacterium]
MTDARAAAQNWARTWRRAWNKRDVEALLALYAPNVAYWSEPYREPFEGIERLREYLVQAFAVEHSINSWFGEPVVDGDRAAVAWWGTLVEDGKPITLAGISLLRFDASGLVTEQWDGWNQAELMRPRPPAWGGG